METLISKMSQYKSVVMFAVVGIVAVWLGFFGFEADLLIDIYRKSAVYFLTAAIIIWLLAFCKEFDDFKRFKTFFKTHHLPLLAAFAVMSLGFIVCKPDYRILADETNLISDSQSLHDFKEPIMSISMLYFGNETKDYIKTSIDKRRAFFPYMLYVCHALTGYRAENAFIMNYIFSSLALFMLYYLIQYRFGYYWGICGMLLMAAFPLYLLCSASAGFEIFNLLCILIFFWLIYKFLKQPNSQWAEILLLWLPLLAQTRYESASGVFIAFPMIWFFMPKAEYSKLSYKFVIMPLLFLPVAWIHILTDQASSWQVEGVEGALSVNNFFNNLYNALEFFFVPKDAYGTIPFLAIIALLFFVRRFWAQKEPYSSVKHPLILAIIVFYFFHSVARFSYILVDLRDTLASRLGIIFLPLIAYGAVSFLFAFFEHFKLKKSFCSIAVVGLFFLCWPNAAANCGVRDMPLFWEFKLSRNFLSDYLPDKREYVILSSRPNLYTPLGYSSVGFSEFEEAKDRILSFYAGRCFRYFVVIQQINKITDKPINKDKLDNFRLQTIFEAQTRENSTYRISKGYPVFAKKEAQQSE